MLCKRCFALTQVLQVVLLPGGTSHLWPQIRMHDQIEVFASHIISFLLHVTQLRSGVHRLCFPYPDRGGDSLVYSAPLYLALRNHRCRSRQNFHLMHSFTRVWLSGILAMVGVTRAEEGHCSVQGKARHSATGGQRSTEPSHAEEETSKQAVRLVFIPRY